MVCNTFNNADKQQVAHSISSDEGVIAVSDGLYHPDYHHGTAAWIICNRQQTAQVFGNNLTPGSKIAQYSHCSELSGLIGVVKHINDLCSQLLMRPSAISIINHEGIFLIRWDN